MREKYVLITGGTSGIGKETVMQLASKNAKIIFCGRDNTKGKQTTEEIKKVTGNKEIDFIQADFCSFHSVKNLVQQIKEKTGRIDVLINNAGFITDKCIVTGDGIESQWSVNYFSPYLLTLLILKDDLMPRGSRIINVSAAAHTWVVGLDYDFSCSKGYSGKNVYAQTKLALNMFTFQLARRLSEKGISVNCLHPGIIRSQFKAQILVPPAVVFKIFFKTPKAGAKTTVFLASDNSVKGLTGKYYIGGKPANSSVYSTNIEEQKKLCDITEKILKL
jgi:NAD(P)-dependent dehydrogenase (short-subunit alcohol dehydrogenase family)